MDKYVSITDRWGETLGELEFSLNSDKSISGEPATPTGIIET